MLTIEYVKSLIDRHQKKAAEHIELLKAKKDCELSIWLWEESVVLYWSHSEVTYLPLNSIDNIDNYLKRVKVIPLIEELDKVKSLAPERLEELYFEYLSCIWRRQGIARSEISQDKASEGFLDRVFKL